MKKGDKHADMGNDEDGFGREDVFEGGEMGVRIGPKEFVCGVELGEENVLAITVETCFRMPRKKWRRKAR